MDTIIDYKEDVVNELDDYRFTYRNIANPKKNEFSKHMHHYLEILFVLEGDINFILEDKVYNLKPYDLLLIPPAQYHFVSIQKPTNYRRYVINFTEQYTDTALLEHVFMRENYFHLSENSEVWQIFTTLHRMSMNQQNDYNRLMCATTLTSILLLLERIQMTAVPSDTASYSVCAPIVEYINNNLIQIKSLDSLAENFFMSKSYLAHMFKNNMGISIMKYIRDKRLLLARTLLISGKKPMEIYEPCGFNDYATFYRAYIKQFGTTPSKIK